MFSAVAGWVLFSGLVLAIGSAITEHIVLPRAALGVDGTERTVTRVGLTGAVMIFIGLILVGARQLLEFRDPFVPWTEDATLLLSLDWGRTWKIALGGSALLLLASLASAFGLRAARWLTLVLALALGFFPGFTGHAAGAEEWRTVALAFDGIHVWGAGAWVGCLACVLWIEHAARRLDPSTTTLPRLVPCFSPVAIAGVAALVVTGAFATWLHVPDRATLTGTTYGGTLLLKVVLVIVALVLGAQNARVLTPKLDTEDGVTELRRTALFELALTQVVLLVTAVLVRTSPLDH